MFRFAEHQADIAIEIEAESREALFRTALESLIILLTGDPDASDSALGVEEHWNQPVDNASIRAAGHDDEERLVDLMNEFLYLCQVNGFWPLRVEDVLFDNRGDIEAVICGLKEHHERTFSREIKAATYHDLKIKTGKVWRVKVVLDV